MALNVFDVPLDQRVTLHVREAEAVSGLSHTTIHALLKSGKLRSIKIGKRRLIDRKSLMEVLAGGAP